MKLLLAVALGFVALCHAVPTTLFEENTPSLSGSESNELHHLFGEENLIQHYPGYVLYKKQFKKMNKDGNEELQRFMTYARNVKKINEHNERYKRGEVTYELGVNHLTDMFPHELQRMRGYKHEEALKQPKNYVSLELDSNAAPRALDWRKKGYVTSVKNQGQCGSCWAFSSTGALEGQHFRKTGQMVSLSEQNLVDCVVSNFGCSGGIMDSAFQYVKENGGIDTEVSYPYEGYDDSCRYKNSTVGANTTGKVDLPQNEDLILQALAKVGPISVALDASGFGFNAYRRGIYSNPHCSKHLNHAVLLVGYGTTNITGKHNTTKKYWIVKNSWGTEWGEDGYFLIERGKNMCGIADMATYPLI